MVSSDYALFGPFVIVRYNSGGSDLHRPWSGADLWFMDHTSFYLSFSKNSNVILFSFSFNFWKEKKNQIMSFFESLRDSIWEGSEDASPWNFVYNKAHQGAFSSFFFSFFFFGFVLFLFLCFCVYFYYYYYYYYYYYFCMYSTCILCLLAPQKKFLKNFLPNIIVFSICLLTFYMIPGRKS